MELLSYPAWLFEAGAVLCSASAVDSSVLASLFLAGLFGGATHCSAMCGPFVMTQVSQHFQRTAPAGTAGWARLSGAAVAPYHLGRLTTYAALGAGAGGLADAFVRATRFTWVPSALLLVAAALFLLQAVHALAPSWRVGMRVPGFLGAANLLSRPLAPLFGDPRRWRGYALGVALGFLPCGLLYAALAAAAGSGSALSGALGLAAFALGTFPALLAVGYGTLLAGQRMRSLVRRTVGPLAAANGAVLVVLALRTLA